MKFSVDLETHEYGLVTFMHIMGSVAVIQYEYTVYTDQIKVMQIYLVDIKWKLFLILRID